LYPRPFDKLFPRASNAVEAFLDRYTTTPLKHLAEGYVAVARRRSR
jgi:hypothetical protein